MELRNMLNKKGYVLVYALALITVLLLLVASLTHITMSRTVWANRQVALINETVQARRVIDLVTVELENRLNNYRKELYHFMDDIDAYFNGEDETAPFRDIEKFFSVPGEYEIIIRNLTEEPCQFSEIKDPNAKACFDKEDYNPSPYTRPYDIVYNGRNIIAQKRFFISIIPSFLYFALGSKSDINLHGGAYIEGDIFVNRNFYFANSANYLVDDNAYNIISTFPSFHPDSKILYSDSKKFNMYYCYQTETNPCFTGLEDGNFYRIKSNEQEEVSFQPTLDTTQLAVDVASTPPRIAKYDYRFLDVFFEESFIHYLNDAIFPEPDETNKHEWITLGANELTRDYLADQLRGYMSYLIEETNPLNITSYNNINRSVYFNRDLVLETLNFVDGGETGVFEIRTDVRSHEDYYTFTFNDDEWIIVNGDLTIKNLNPNINPILIDANFLVLGNIIITGNVLLSSSTYVLGEAIIHDANINLVPELEFEKTIYDKDYDNDSNTITVYNNLVLSVNGNIQFSRINEFQNDNLGKSQFTPSIRGFFFSNSYIQVYTISSYLVIEGGIFSQDSKNVVDGEVRENEYIQLIGEDETPDEYNSTNSIGLLVNSIRGEVAPGDANFQPFRFYRTGIPEDYANFRSISNARFVLLYSPSVIQHQPKGLPLNNQVNYVIEDIKIIRK